MKIESESSTEEAPTYLVEQLLQSAQVESYAADLAQNWRHIVYPCLYFLLSYAFTRVFMHAVKSFKFLVYPALKRAFDVDTATFVVWPTTELRVRVSTACTLCHGMFAYALMRMCTHAASPPDAFTSWWQIALFSRVWIWACLVVIWTQKVYQHWFPSSPEVLVNRMISPCLWVVFVFADGTNIKWHLFKPEAVMGGLIVQHVILTMYVVVEAFLGRSAQRRYLGEYGNEPGHEHEDGPQAEAGGYESPASNPATPRPISVKKNA